MTFDIDIQAISIPVPPTPLHLDKMQWGQSAVQYMGPVQRTMLHTYISSTKSGLDLHFKSVYVITVTVKVLFRKEKRESPPGAGRGKRALNHSNNGTNYGCRFHFGSQCVLICLFDLNSNSDCGLTKTRNCHSNEESPYTFWPSLANSIPRKALHHVNPLVRSFICGGQMKF